MVESLFTKTFLNFIESLIYIFFFFDFFLYNKVRLAGAECGNWMTGSVLAKQTTTAKTLVKLK